MHGHHGGVYHLCGGYPFQGAEAGGTAGAAACHGHAHEHDVHASAGIFPCAVRAVFQPGHSVDGLSAGALPHGAGSENDGDLAGGGAVLRGGAAAGLHPLRHLPEGGCAVLPAHGAGGAADAGDPPVHRGAADDAPGPGDCPEPQQGDLGHGGLRAAGGGCADPGDDRAAEDS